MNKNQIMIPLVCYNNLNIDTGEDKVMKKLITIICITLLIGGFTTSIAKAESIEGQPYVMTEEEQDFLNALFEIPKYDDPTKWITEEEYNRINMEYLIKDGVIEPEVIEQPQEVKEDKIKSDISNKNTKTIQFSKEDLKVLAGVIHCEARGETYEGMLAVGTVVMNRVISGDFPNTIKGVVFQKNQFCTDPDFFYTPSERCIEAAQEVLEGNRSFNEDVLAFYAHKDIRPNHPMLKWKKHCVIKNHTFTYIGA